MRTSNLILHVTLGTPEFWRWYAFDEVEPESLARLAAYCSFGPTVVLPQPTGWYLSLEFDLPADHGALSLCRSQSDGTFDARIIGERHRLGRRYPDRPHRPCLDWADVEAVAERSMFTMFHGVDPWQATLLLAPWVGHPVDDDAGLAAHRQSVADVLAGQGMFDTGGADRIASLLLAARTPGARPGRTAGADAAMASFRRQIELGGAPRRQTGSPDSRSARTDRSSGRSVPESST